MTDEEPMGKAVPDEPPGKLPKDTVVYAQMVGDSDANLATSGNAALCPNCETPINGPFCATCGQSQKNLNKQVWSLAGEVLDDLFRLDSRISRTLFSLFFRPGFLTTEYFDGRRARYSPPIRLYLVISFLFFFTTPIINNLDSASSEDGQIITIGNDVEDGENELSTNLSGINLSWLSKQENEALITLLERQIKKAVARVEEDPSGLWSEVMDLMSAVMFFMLPIFAIFLKLFYIGSGIYYAEHLLLALHNHCFLFLATLLTGCLELLETSAVGVATEPVASLITFWIPVYMYLSLKKTFGQSHGITALKFSFLAMVYIVLASLGLATALSVEVLTQ